MIEYGEPLYYLGAVFFLCLIAFMIGMQLGSISKKA